MTNLVKKQETESLSIEERKRRASRLERRLTIVGVMILALCTFGVTVAFAMDTSTGVSEIDTMFTNFNKLLTGILRFVGGCLLLFGGAKFGTSFQSHDPSQRTTGLMFVLSGIIVILTPEIINAL